MEHKLLEFHKFPVNYIISIIDHNAKKVKLTIDSFKEFQLFLFS